MVRLMTLVLGLAMVVALSGDAAWAKGKKPAAKPKIPAGYAKIESVNTTDKTFKLAGDPKVYKYTDTTFNKELISAGTTIKVTLKAGSEDEVTVVDKQKPPQKKGGGKKKK